MSEKTKGGGNKWLIIGIVIVVIGVLSSNGNDSDSTKNTNVVQDVPDQELPSIVVLYENLGSNEAIPYTVTDKAKNFLQEHENMFPAKDEVDADLINYSVDYRQVLKNEKKFGDKLMYIADAGVVEIHEDEYSEGEYITSLNITDGEQQYIVYYIGELDKIFEDSEVSVIGLPLGTSFFENTAGGTTQVIVLAGTQIEEVSGNYWE